MTDPSTENLTKSIKAILKDADLDQLSAKKIRKTLEVDYKTDLTDRKDEIDKLVMQLITENESEDEKEATTKKETKVDQKITNGSSTAPKRSASPAKQDKDSGEGGDDNLSNDDDAEEEEDDDDSDLGEIEDAVPAKKAKVQPSAKKSKTSKKMNDEELAKQLQEDEGLRPSRRCKAQPVVRKQKKPRKESAKGTSVYSRPCALLSPLKDVMGTDKMPRPMIVKRLWEIVKERDLLDPKNKQFMLCDTEMQGLFGKGRVRMFSAMKLLKPYIKDLPKE